MRDGACLRRTRQSGVGPRAVPLFGEPHVSGADVVDHYALQIAVFILCESVTMQNHVDTGSMVVIVITFVCFAIALFAKGLTQALLLEVGVLLVSVKLIIMAFKSSLANTEIVAELRAIRDLLEQDGA